MRPGTCVFEGVGVFKAVPDSSRRWEQDRADSSADVETMTSRHHTPGQDRTKKCLMVSGSALPPVTGPVTLWKTLQCNGPWPKSTLQQFLTPFLHPTPPPKPDGQSINRSGEKLLFIPSKRLV